MAGLVLESELGAITISREVVADIVSQTAQRCYGVVGLSPASRVRRILRRDGITVRDRKGKVVDLPAGATPVDFAYTLHTDLGHRCRGARVDGQMVPLDAVVRMRETTSPAVISHFNLYRSAEITGSTLPGVSSGQGLQAMADLAKQTLPGGFDFSWAGQSLEEIKAGSQAIYIFALSILLVYLVLAAQFESLTLPVAVILIVPMCLIASIVGVVLRGQDNNILTQVGFIVLIGLAAKNAILIVEFAKQLEDQGRSRWEAAVEAAQLRLRPILMTSLAFIFGVVPLVWATGAGAELRQTLGTAVFSGMIGVTVFGLIFTPVFYVVSRWLAERLTWRRKPAAHQPAE